MKTCVFNRENNRIILILILVSIFLLVSILLFFYMSIFKTIKQAIKMKINDPVDLLELQAMILTNEGYESSIDELKKAFKLAKGLFVMYFMYTLSAFPLFIIVLIDDEQKFPSYAHMYSWLFLRMCAAATPVVYPLYHVSIRQGYMNVFRLIFMTYKRPKKIARPVKSIKTIPKLNKEKCCITKGKAI